MMQIGPSVPTSRAARWRLGLGVLVRVSVTIALLFTAYFLLPVRGVGHGSDLPWLLLEMAVFGVIVAAQVPVIVKAKYPILRAVEALSVTVPLFLLIFSRIYLANSLASPTAFTQPLDTSTALYFTVTVFATVGFGDIVALTDSMRMLVTVQMLLDLAVLGVVIKLLTSAARHGVALRDRHDEPDTNRDESRLG